MTKFNAALLLAALGGIAAGGCATPVDTSAESAFEQNDDARADGVSKRTPTRASFASQLRDCRSTYDTSNEIASYLSCLRAANNDASALINRALDAEQAGAALDAYRESGAEFCAAAIEAAIGSQRDIDACLVDNEASIAQMMLDTLRFDDLQAPATEPIELFDALRIENVTSAAAPVCHEGNRSFLESHQDRSAPYMHALDEALNRCIVTATAYAMYSIADASAESEPARDAARLRADAAQASLERFYYDISSVCRLATEASFYAEADLWVRAKGVTDCVHDQSTRIAGYYDRLHSVGTDDQEDLDRNGRAGYQPDGLPPR